MLVTTIQLWSISYLTILTEKTDLANKMAPAVHIEPTFDVADGAFAIFGQPPPVHPNTVRMRGKALRPDHRVASSGHVSVGRARNP